MSSQPRPKNVLILDDSSVVLDMARKYLEAAGYEVSTALTLAEFDDLKDLCSPDLILLDVQMPEFDGDDLGIMLRDERGVTVPIVLFSTLATEELERRAVNAGLHGFVSKNDGLDALVVEVQTILGDL